MESDNLFKKALSKYNAWFKFIDKERYNHEAYELFNKAKNLYINEEKYSNAKKCFDYSILCLSSLENFDYELATLYQKYGSFQLDKLKDFNEAFKLYNKAIDIYIQIGESEKIIKIKETIGQFFKSKNDFGNSIKIYEEINNFKIENEYTFLRINKILFELYVFANDFEKAFETYDKLIPRVSGSNKISKFILADLIFHAMLCYIVNDAIVIEPKLQYYCDKNPSFEQSTDYELIKFIINNLHTENFDEENFLMKCEYYKKLNNLEIKIINKIIEKYMSEENINFLL